jgi:hypothetical protein
MPEAPRRIARDNGMRMYFHPEHREGRWRGVHFSFVGDCASPVRTDR